MQLIRIFSTAKAKGTEGYIRSQKKYEVIRTLLYFAVSLSLYVAGYIQTGQRANLLTIVAVLASRQQKCCQRHNVSAGKGL